jgi:hypothetical protein
MACKLPFNRANRKSFEELLTRSARAGCTKKACFQPIARIRRLQRGVSMPRHIDTHPCPGVDTRRNVKGSPEL